LYINGVNQVTTANTGTPTANTGGIRLMRRWDGDEYWSGNLSIVKIYNRALSATEIKQNFEICLEIGSSVGLLEGYISSNKITKIINTDISLSLLGLNKSSNKILLDHNNGLPFKNNSFDIVISILSLHNSNNLLQGFKEIYRVLKPNGLFLSVFPAYGTLSVLGQSLYETELELYQGYSPRVHPFADIKTLGNLLQDASFKEIVADSDTITIMYKDCYQLLKDLKNNGENNILTNQNNKIVQKNFFPLLMQKMEKYKDQEAGCYPINLELANLVAWKL
jgi:NADH dehydrogenase [ubiquinone] 1 alpha subcomplex assembly factor 5